MVRYNNESGNIQKLKEITPKLPKFPTPIGDSYDNECQQYKMVQGTCFAWNLMWIEDISVSKWFFSKDTIFPEHSHVEKEIIIIYRGEMNLEYSSGNICNLKRGQVISHPPGVTHKAYFPVDTMAIIVTIPASYDYPGHGEDDLTGGEFHE